MTAPKLLPFLLVAASCAPAAPTPLSQAERETVASEVRAASMGLVDALNAHDADAILAFYSLDDDFTQVACTSFILGGTGFANLTRALHASYGDAAYDMTIQDVRVLGADGAVVSLKGTMLAPLFVTRVLRRAEDGRWLVVWEHESWPGCPSPTPPHPGTSPEDTLSSGAVPEIP